jgi:hypothetical protein
VLDIKENPQMTKGIMYNKDFLELGGTNFIEAMKQYSLKFKQMTFFKV